MKYPLQTTDDRGNTLASSSHKKEHDIEQTTQTGSVGYTRRRVDGQKNLHHPFAINTFPSDRICEPRIHSNDFGSQGRGGGESASRRVIAQKGRLPEEADLDECGRLQPLAGIHKERDEEGDGVHRGKNSLRLRKM